MHKAAQTLQEDYGTKHVHKKMLAGGDSFDSKAFGDIQKVLGGRLRMEKPELDIIFGKVPDKSSGAFARTVQKRIEFASKYKYPKDIVTAETDRLTSK